LIAWGYQRKEAEIRQNHLEENITGLICMGIDEKFDEEELPSRFEHYSVKNEAPVNDVGALGKKRPKIDIVIERRGSRPRKRYRLEAKRCARNQNSISWYAEGIVMFLNRTYAKDSPEGGLLGLMQSDDAKHWTQKLSLKLDKDASLEAQSPLTGVALIPDLAGMSVSQHRRNDDSFITLYHAFLDCNP
jgi:hypothetical protein